MAAGGYETDPLILHYGTGENNDSDTTGPFQLESLSSPAPERIPTRTSTSNRPSEARPQAAEISFIEGPNLSK